MRTKKLRKQPVSHSRAPTVSSKVTQTTISAFHTLQKQKAKLSRQLIHAEQSTLREELAKVEEKLEALGGLDAYQKASQLGQSVERGGDSSKVLIAWLRERGECLADKGKNKAGNEIPRLRLLEIGALSPSNYTSCSTWIDNQPIDLHSQHRDILEQDFLLRPLPRDESEQFDIISCSLVLNFVSEAIDRGRMLMLIHRHLRPSSSSLLFLVLPSPCIYNSRYMSDESLRSLMTTVGFELVKDRIKPGGKVGYWLWRWMDPAPVSEWDRWKRKSLLQDGRKRNNFAILLPELPLP